MIKRNINNKGFTLIELLAVIVILGIVMVVTIPTVLNAMSNAKHEQFNNTIQAVSDWLTKQYSLSALEYQTSSEYRDFISKYGIYDSYIATQNGDHNLASCTAESLAMLEAAGLTNPADVIELNKTYVWFSDDGVAIKAKAKEGGMFYVSGENNNTFVNYGVNDEQFLDGNIFDMSVITSNATKSGDYWTNSFSNIFNKFSRSNNRCGFIANFGSGECTSFYGQKFTFKTNKQYKVTFEGYTDDSTNKSVIYVSYGPDDRKLLITIPTSNSKIEASTVANKTVGFIYISYKSGGNKNGDIYIKSLKVEEVN